jgi:uridine kinase
MDQGTRDEMLSCLAKAVRFVTVAHPTRVAIDGPPAAGKTTLADPARVRRGFRNLHPITARLSHNF